MSAEQQLNRDGDESLTAQVRAVLDNRLKRREAGEPESDEDLIAAHPYLMPLLGEELRKLRIVAGAR